MAEAAFTDLPYPETAVVAEDTLAGQILALASDLPERPLVLGGCCCSHVGAVEGLATRHDRFGIVWVDAHGDLNTPESSPSGNEWGMPLRMILDAGAVDPTRVALVGARDLDPPERDFISDAGIHTGAHAVDRALQEVDCVYVALDFDGLDDEEVAAFMPVPGGIRLEEAIETFRRLAAEKTVLGAGFTGLVPDERNLEPAAQLASALGL